MKKLSFCHILQVTTDIITIFGRDEYIYRGIIFVKCCAILPQNVWVIEIFLLLRIFVILEIIDMENYENQQQIYIQFARM